MAQRIQKINYNGRLYNVGGIPYAICSTGGSTAAKVVDSGNDLDFLLADGANIIVRFTETILSESPTLKVGNTPAKPIRYNGSILTPESISANQTCEFVYDEAQDSWLLVGGTGSGGSTTITDGVVLKGAVMVAGDVPAIHETGWAYRVATTGTYVGQRCEVGDLLLCIADGSSSNNNDWIVLQRNVDNALYKGSNTLTNNQMLLADGADGKVKSVAISPVLANTANSTESPSSITVTVGGVTSAALGFNAATTGNYGETILTNTPSANEEAKAATPKLVDTAITNKINDLDVTDTAVATQYVSAVNETNGAISVSRANFAPTVTVVSGDDENTPKVKISVAGNESAAVALNAATIGAYGATILTNTPSGNEMAKAATPKLVNDAIASTIEGLAVTDTAVAGKYVSSVSEEDGEISVTRANFSPAITITSGDQDNTPKINVSVGGATGTAQGLNAATASAYGVTILNNDPGSTPSNESTAVTPAGLMSVIQTLDATVTGTPGAAKTLTAFGETDGKVSATFGDIAIAASQITSGTLPVSRGGTGQTAIANIQAGKDAEGNVITTTYATKEELNNIVSATNAMVFKGLVITENDLPAIHEKGWTYKVATAGTYAGQVCEVGDLIICIAEGNTANNADWGVIQVNVDSALFKGTNSFTNNHILLADGTNGKVKSVAANPTLTLTGASGDDTDKIKFSFGGFESSEEALSTATTSNYGVTKLTSTVADSNEVLAATPKLVATKVNNVVNGLNVTDSADSSKYVSAVSESKGKISVSRASFNPTVTISNGATSDDTPTVSISVAGNSATAVAMPSATTSSYGVTKLSNATNSISESIAATSKAVKAAYDLAASKTDNVGTITGVTANAGLTGGGTSGTVTIGHSNSIDAVADEALYKLKWDAYGHITGAISQGVTDNTTNKDVTSNDSNLITARTLYYQLQKKGYTTNTGTVTSVSAGDGLTGGPVTTTGSLAHSIPTGAEAGVKGTTGRTYIQSITTDKFGHLTGYTTATETVTDTHYTAKNVVANSKTSTTQAASALTNGNVYLNLVENGAVQSSQKIAGGDLVSVAAAATSGDITVSHTAPSGATAGIYNDGNADGVYIKTITTDAYGHVTGATTGAVPDTKNTTGATDTSSKIFLVGAATQDANPQTYSDDQVYATNGQLDANKVRVAEQVTLQYNSTTKSLDFVFA